MHQFNTVNWKSTTKNTYNETVSIDWNDKVLVKENGSLFVSWTNGCKMDDKNVQNDKAGHSWHVLMSKLITDDEAGKIAGLEQDSNWLRTIITQYLQCNRQRNSLATSYQPYILRQWI